MRSHQLCQPIPLPRRKMDRGFYAKPIVTGGNLIRIVLRSDHHNPPASATEAGKEIIVLVHVTVSITNNYGSSGTRVFGLLTEFRHFLRLGYATYAVQDRCQSVTAYAANQSRESDRFAGSRLAFNHDGRTGVSVVVYCIPDPPGQLWFEIALNGKLTTNTFNQKSRPFKIPMKSPKNIVAGVGPQWRQKPTPSIVDNGSHGFYAEPLLRGCDQLLSVGKGDHACVLGRRRCQIT